MSASQILSQAYVTAGRQLYHNKLCLCCKRITRTDSNIESVREFDDCDRKSIDAGNSNRSLVDVDDRISSDTNYLDPICLTPINIELNPTSTIEDFRGG